MNLQSGKIITAIKSFQDYSNLVIEQCASFSAMAKNAGSVVGTLVKMSGRKNGLTDPVTGFVLNKLGEQAVKLGQYVGDKNREKKYIEAEKKLREDGEEWKIIGLPIVKEFVEAQEKYENISDMCFDDLVCSIKSASLDCEDDLKKNVDYIHYCIASTYQQNFINVLSRNIIKYFDLYESKLSSGLESFSTWFCSNILIDKSNK